MSLAHQMLYDEIVSLPHEKVGKALSFVRFLVQEPEPELILDTEEEKELFELYSSSNFVDADSVLAKIMELAND